MKPNRSSHSFRLDFLGLGFARSGTTWINQLLNEHPQICMPLDRELTYFCMDPLWSTVCNSSKGMGWLESKFNHSLQGQILGEYNTIYISDPHSPLMIKNVYPNIKMIISYRNPTERLYSMYQMLKHLYGLGCDFEGFLDKYPKYIETGYYYTLTQRYLDIFNKNQFHFIVYDDILSKPERVVYDLFNFLEVDTSFKPMCLHERINVSRESRFPILSKAIGNTSEYIKSQKWGNHVHQFLAATKLHLVARKITELNSSKNMKKPITKTTKLKLDQLYKTEIKQLSGLLKNETIAKWTK